MVAGLQHTRLLMFVCNVAQMLASRGRCYSRRALSGFSLNVRCGSIITLQAMLYTGQGAWMPQPRVGGKCRAGQLFSNTGGSKDQVAAGVLHE
jgi:hypothetical protein